VHKSEASKQRRWSNKIWKRDSHSRNSKKLHTTDVNRVVWKKLLPTDMKSNPDLLLKESKNLSARRSANKKWFFCSVLAQKKN
jgi:hypothetical protein